MTYNPDNRPGDPTVELPEKEELFKCEFDGNMYWEQDMYSLGYGEFVAKKNLEAFAKREVSEHEVKEYINLIIKENGKA